MKKVGVALAAVLFVLLAACYAGQRDKGSAPTGAGTPPTVPSPATAPGKKSTPVPIATIVIQALQNPYRFEPNIVTLKAGSTYTLELIGGEEDHSFVVNNADLRFYAIIPARGTLSIVFTAPDRDGRFVFYDPSYKEYDMVGVFIVTKD
jgi:plastocyanin